MANTLNLGDGNWGVKDSSLLGYAKDNTKFVPETFDVTRASSGTRVNKDGLIETVAEIGNELVTNGNFSDGSTDWGVSNVTVQDEVCKFISTGSGGTLTSTTAQLISGKQYIVKFEITYQDGISKVKINNSGASGVFKDNVNLYEQLFTCTSTTYLQFYFTNAGSCFIDNVSVKEYNDENLARIDYTDGVEGVLLTEPQSTNLVAYSEDFSDSSWNKDNISVQSNAAISPDGTLNADKITSTASGVAFYNVMLLEVIGSLNSSVKTNSFFVKSNGQRFVYLVPANGNSDAVYFDLENGILGAEKAASKGEIKSYGNGWYRISISNPATPAYSYAGIGFCDADDSPVYTQTSNSIYAWGAQSEELSYATSYMPTYGQIASRAGDEVTNGGDVSNFNSEEGVLYAEVSNVAKNYANNISITNGTNSQRVQIYFNNVDLSLMFFVRVNGALIGTHIVSSSGINYEDTNKIAIKYKTNDMSFWLNGTKVGTETSGTMFAPNTLNQLGLNSGGGGEFYGKTKNLQVFNEALTDAELITLTSL